MAFPDVRRLATAMIFAAVATSSFGFDRRYWVWQRDDPLGDEEIAELAAQNVETIYWQVGELENSGVTWHWRSRFDFPRSEQGGLHFIPAVRLVSHEREPFSDASVADLITRLAPVARNADELQLDYDAPDRLLSEYSAALTKIHQIARKLTITALPHWSRPDCLAVLQSSVDELLPMLYDFEAEPVLKNELPLPLITPGKISKFIDDWRRYSKPCRVGLPVFSRLSLYDSNRKLRGQIRNWNWDEVCFNHSFEVISPSGFATFILLATKPAIISNTPIKAGEELVVHEVDRAALREAVRAAERAGAQSVVFFRLPDGSASSGWSLHQIGHLDASPRLTAKYSASEQCVELFNAGDGDLEPGIQSSGGYSLELVSDAAMLREAHAGDFASLTTYSGEKSATIPFATRLQFRFSQLRAKERLRTGLIQLAPGGDFRQARYRILNMEGGSSWKTLE